MKKLFIILILFSCFSFAKMSFNETLKLAEQGNATAQFLVGGMYYHSEGVKQDYFKAFYWFKEAATQGNVTSQFNLGVMYLNGEGVRLNKSKSLHYFGLSCDNKYQKGCEAYAKLKKEGITE